MADDTLLTLTTDIVAAHVSNNRVADNDLPTLITNVYQSLSRLGEQPAAAEPEKPKGKVGIRASIKPDHLVSMIDGKKYKLLRGHLRQNGYTPESYRKTFGLPHDYPIVAPEYAAQRRELAKRIGLGTKAKRGVRKVK